MIPKYGIMISTSMASLPIQHHSFGIMKLYWIHVAAVPFFAYQCQKQPVVAVSVFLVKDRPYILKHRGHHVVVHKTR